jgi:hypothetical protein
MEYDGIANKGPSHCCATLSPEQHEKFWVALSWEADRVNGPKWNVHRRGTREEVADFIEEWLLRCPDSELLAEAIEKLYMALPPGVL